MYPPTGGIKDSIPPVLLLATPGDSAIEFATDRITLEFNEYIQIDNTALNRLVVSPYPTRNPVILSKLKTVTIRLRDTLAANTTYSINFGDAIQDINERNPYKDFTYVFSTGSYIDDASVSGRVTVAESGAVDSTLLVILHDNLEDSAIKTERPDYIARVNGDGTFRFKYLPANRFNIFVLPDDFSKKYDDSTKMFAFYNQPISLDSGNASGIELYAYEEEKKNETPFTSPTTKSKDKDTAAKKLTFKVNLPDDQQDLLSPFHITLSDSIAIFDSTRIILTDTNYNVITGYTFSADSTGKDFYINYPWRENQAFRLEVNPGAFADTSGTTFIAADTISFFTRLENSYGSIRLRFGNLDLSRNPVLQFIQNGNIQTSVPINDVEIYRRLFEGGEYELRILYDTNGNTIWDPGNYEMRKQPEIVQLIPEKINIRRNWDNEKNINL